MLKHGIIPHATSHERERYPISVSDGIVKLVRGDFVSFKWHFVDRAVESGSRGFAAKDESELLGRDYKT